MNRQTFVALLLFACCVVSTGCGTFFNKYAATDLRGTPDSSGVVVVESQVEVLAAIFGVHTDGAPTGGLLARVDGGGESVHGGMALGLIVFSGLQPGRWHLISIDGDWPALNSTVHQTFAVPPELAQEFTLEVRAGEPVYLGVVRAEYDRRAKSQGVRFEIKPDPAAEKKAWAQLVEIYGDGDWGPSLRAKL